jgi:osmotically-inducible protein OsmY
LPVLDVNPDHNNQIKCYHTSIKQKTAQNKLAICSRLQQAAKGTSDTTLQKVISSTLNDENGIPSTNYQIST